MQEKRLARFVGRQAAVVATRGLLWAIFKVVGGPTLATIIVSGVFAWVGGLRSPFILLGIAVSCGLLMLLATSLLLFAAVRRLHKGGSALTDPLLVPLGEETYAIGEPFDGDGMPTLPVSFGVANTGVAVAHIDEVRVDHDVLQWGSVDAPPTILPHKEATIRANFQAASSLLPGERFSVRIAYHGPSEEPCEPLHFTFRFLSAGRWRIERVPKDSGPLQAGSDQAGLDNVPAEVRPISVRIDREPEWSNLDYRAWILKLHVVVTNNTDSDKQIQDILSKGRHATVMADVLVAQHVAQQLATLAQLIRHSVLEPGVANPGWVIHAFPWTEDGVPPTFSLVVRVEGVEYEASLGDGLA